MSLSARSSAINVALPWRTLPRPNGGDAGNVMERQHLAFAYARFAAALVFAGGIQPSGMLLRIRALAGSIMPSGNLLKMTGRVLDGEILPTGDLLKMAILRLGGVIQPAGDVVAVTGAGLIRLYAFLRGSFIEWLGLRGEIESD